MEDVIKIASYICQRYEYEFGSRIDEMKLHKLLYFCQREAFIQLGEPMFAQKFRARLYGPVMLEVHEKFKSGELVERLSDKALEKYRAVFDRVFAVYAIKDVSSLVAISKGQYSYVKVTKSFGWMQPRDVEMQTEDIRIDAERFKMRHFMLSQLEEVRNHQHSVV